MDILTASLEIESCKSIDTAASMPGCECCATICYSSASAGTSSAGILCFPHPTSDGSLTVSCRQQGLFAGAAALGAMGAAYYMYSRGTVPENPQQTSSKASPAQYSAPGANPSEAHTKK